MKPSTAFTETAFTVPDSAASETASGALNPTPKHADLIYDVGMHKGEDTAFYLKKGFRVVGFEANPENAADCRRRFAREIEEKRLTIIEGAIVESDFSSKVRFFRNVDHSPWGSASEDWAQRNEVMGTSNEVIEVAPTDFKKCLTAYGVPHYLKADIVGLEIVCLRALLEFENKPDFVSIRSEKFVFSKLEREFDVLEKLGYTAFQAVQQDVSAHEVTVETFQGDKITHRFDEGASGVFGQDLEPENWKSKNQILNEYRTIFALYRWFGDYSFLRRSDLGRRVIGRLERILQRPLPGWYDTHAKHSSSKLLSFCFYATFVFPL